MVNTIETGKRLKKTLQQRGIKLMEFALAAGITNETLSRYVNGKREIPEKFIEKAARLLSVSVEYLLCESDDETPPEYQKYCENMDTLERESARQQRKLGATKSYIEHFGVKVLEEIRYGNVVYTKQRDFTWEINDVSKAGFPVNIFSDEIDEISEKTGVKPEHIFTVEYRGVEMELSSEDYYEWLNTFIIMTELNLKLKMNVK